MSKPYCKEEGRECVWEDLIFDVLASSETEGLIPSKQFKKKCVFCDDIREVKEEKVVETVEDEFGSNY